ncbi:MAG: hypothetical protein ACK4GL_03425 [Flavobacteriales bacterium]
MPIIQIKLVCSLLVIFLASCNFGNKEKEAIVLGPQSDGELVVAGTSFATEKIKNFEVFDPVLNNITAYHLQLPETFDLKGTVIWTNSEVDKTFYPQPDFRCHNQTYQCGFTLLPNILFADLKGKNAEDNQLLEGVNNPFRMVQPAEDAMRTHIFQMLQNRFGRVKIYKVSPANKQNKPAAGEAFEEFKTMVMDFEFESGDNVYESFIRADYYVRKGKLSANNRPAEDVLFWGYDNLVCFHFPRGKGAKLGTELETFYQTIKKDKNWAEASEKAINSPDNELLSRMNAVQNKRNIMLKSSNDASQRAFRDSQSPFHSKGKDWWDKQTEMSRQ